MIKKTYILFGVAVIVILLIGIILLSKKNMPSLFSMGSSESGSNQSRLPVLDESYQISLNGGPRRSPRPGEVMELKVGDKLELFDKKGKYVVVPKGKTRIIFPDKNS